jgi:hypothetical protein
MDERSGNMCSCASECLGPHEEPAYRLMPDVK